MAEALCGPSNPLQSFQKHSGVDRSLQQDRLAFQRPLNQGFRSSPRHGPSGADVEFQAFQATSPFAFQGLPNHSLLQPNHPRDPKPASLAGWASEFQHLRINDSQAAPSAARATTRQPAAAQHSNWHQDFLQADLGGAYHHTQYQPESSRPSQFVNFQPSFAAARSHEYTSRSYQHRTEAKLESHREQDMFSKEFDLVQQEIDVSEGKGKQKEAVPESETQAQDGTVSGQHVLSHADSQMGDVMGDYDYNTDMLRWSDEVGVDQLRATRNDGGWEAISAYERAVEMERTRLNSDVGRNLVENIQQLRQEESQGEKSTAADLTLAMEDGLQSSSEATGIRIGADTIPASQQQAEPAGPDAEADELAKTAGQLLHNLRDEQSSKFQQSNFMELMRQLRDKEARIEGENMIKQGPHPGGKFYPSDAFGASQPSPLP